MTYNGIDIVHIPRFESWLGYSNKQLLTIFTQQEVVELAQRAPRQAAFLASRFAVKEAFYKALSAASASDQSIQPFGFRSIARFIEVTPDTRWHAPLLFFNAEEFTYITGIKIPPLNATVSISHDGDYAIAQVLISL